jgi:pimeloyl-ACP methyl ester carboxylesterase
MIVRILASVAGAIAVPVVGGLAYRKVHQRWGAKVLMINTPNGICEERFVRIGGIEQWIQIRGEDRTNPVLLVVHGGPGWPNATFTLPLRSWEKHFTVVQWDQRGVSKTLGRNGKEGSGEMSFERRISDAIELTEFLRNHLRKDKVILLAESMGTLVGAPLVKRRPDLFYAYVGTDQYVDMARNEALKYQMTLERVCAAGNTKGVAALEKIGGDPTRWDLRAWNVNMAWTFKTNVPTPNLDKKLLLPLVLTSPIYTFRDIYHLGVGFQFSTTQLFEQFMAYDARQLGTHFEIPFFLFQGETDVVTPTALAEEYFAEVEALTKGFALIEDAGHFAAFTQPEQFLTELLGRVGSLGTPTDLSVGHRR